MKRFAGSRVALAVLGAVSMAASAKAQPVRFLVSWSGQSDIVRPAPRLSRFQIDIEVTLRGGNRVSERYLRRGADGQVRLQSGGDATFAQEIEGTSVKWSVRDARTLVRTLDMPTHINTIVLTTDGKSSCRGRIENRLKPGEQTYMIAGTRPREFASKITLGPMRCRVL